MEALFVFGDNQSNQENNTSQYRILGPAKYLERAGHTIRYQSMPGTARVMTNLSLTVETDQLDYGEVCETVLFERNITPERVQKMRLMGAKRIIVTFDDHYGILPSYMRSREFWNRNYTKFLKALGMVDTVIVPNVRLIEEFETYCEKIVYVPNYLDPEVWPEPKADREKIIGWGGSAAHIESWRNPNFSRALIRVLDAHPDWKLRSYGTPLPQPLGSHPQVEQRDWVLFFDWPKEVNEFAVGIAPLHGEYDNFRSNLKVLEYNRLGIPWLASERTPYTRPMRLEGGFVAKEREWERILTNLVESHELRSELSEKGLAESQDWTMDRHVDQYERLLWK